MMTPAVRLLMVVAAIPTVAGQTQSQRRAAQANPLPPRATVPDLELSRASSSLEGRVREYMDLVAGGSDAGATAYVARTFTPEALAKVNVEDRVEDIGRLRYLLGRFRLVDFKADSAWKGSLIVEDEVGRLQKLTIETEPTAPHRLVEVSFPQGVPGLAVAPRNDGQRAVMLDAFVGRLARTRFFSGAVLLARDGKPLLERAYGESERRFGVRNTVDTRFYLGSITKSFTAVGIGQLVDQGKLSWDDPLAKYLPDFPSKEAAARIRIKHLLSMTSGLSNDAFPPDWPVPSQSRTVAQMVAMAPRQPLLFEPGSQYRYSNLNFLLLGRILEIASGEDYYRYIADHVFAPAGMASAGTGRYDVAEKLSYAYEPILSLDHPTYVDGRSYVAARSTPFGGAYATVGDLLRFDRALNAGALVKPATWAVMSAPKPELSNPHWGFGFNVDNSEMGGPGGLGGKVRTVVGRGGNQVGVCTIWGRIEDAGVPYTFVVLANSGMLACYPVAEYIFDLISPRHR